jgi:glycosyltransferase involved in cell wall biosynthesis
MGERRRVESWVRLFQAAGAEVHRVPLLTGDRRLLPHVQSFAGRALTVAAGGSVPEALAWSRPALCERLRGIDPALVIVVTARAFDPSLGDRWTTVLDLVDRLSVSYRDRAPYAAGRPQQLGYRGLGWTAARFERRVVGGAAGTIATVAAGWADAEALSVEWVPILVDDHRLTPGGKPGRDEPGRDEPVDVLFFGTLSYPPNVEAVVRLARVWPAVLAARPGTTALIAGATPTSRVREEARRCGWRLEADFADLAGVARQCGIAVAPLVHASGIQIKVLDAATLGLPQVVTPAALAGLAPGFPALVARDDDDLVTGIVELLNDPERRPQLAAEARAHVEDVYGLERWLPWAERLLRN